MALKDGQPAATGEGIGATTEGTPKTTTLILPGKASGETREMTVAVERIDHADITALVDTNVLIDVYSCHDLTKAAESKLTYRLQRARDAVLLAVYLDQVKATTASVQEPIPILARCVPPDLPSKELAFTKLFLNFTKDHILGAWKERIFTDTDPRGSVADHYLEDLAVSSSLPLITCEDRLTERASARGAKVYSPRAFWSERGLDEEHGVQRFLRRFDAERGHYLRRCEDQRSAELWLDQVFALYRKVLLNRG